MAEWFRNHVFVFKRWSVKSLQLEFQNVILNLKHVNLFIVVVFIVKSIANTQKQIFAYIYAWAGVFPWVVNLLRMSIKFFCVSTIMSDIHFDNVTFHMIIMPTISFFETYRHDEYYVNNMNFGIYSSFWYKLSFAYVAILLWIKRFCSMNNIT